MTAPAETDALTVVDAEPARHYPAQYGNDGRSMNEASPHNALRLHLRTARGQTARGAVPILVRAFSRTPLARWLYPSLGERGSRLRAVFEQLVDDATTNGSIVLAYQGGTTVGAVLWSSCPARDDTDPAPTAFTPHDPDNARLTVLADRLAHCHPPEPHEHVQALAVLPIHQGQGIAGALLASATTRPATSRYLLTPGPLPDLLHQLGYQPHGTPIVLPDDGPPLQPFWCTAPPPQPSVVAPRRRSAPAERAGGPAGSRPNVGDSRAQTGRLV